MYHSINYKQDNSISVITIIIHIIKNWNQVKTLMIITCLIYFDIVLGIFVIMYRNDYFILVYYSQTQKSSLLLLYIFINGVYKDSYVNIL